MHDRRPARAAANREPLSLDGLIGCNSTENVDDDPARSIQAAGDVPLGGTVVAITAGQFHTCAPLSTGAVRCWGLGSSGQLGYNSQANVGDDPALRRA